jgi:hypothetical protein
VASNLGQSLLVSLNSPLKLSVPQALEFIQVVLLLPNYAFLAMSITLSAEVMVNPTLALLEVVVDITVAVAAVSLVLLLVGTVAVGLPI